MLDPAVKGITATSQVNNLTRRLNNQGPAVGTAPTAVGNVTQASASRRPVTLSQVARKLSEPRRLSASSMPNQHDPNPRRISALSRMANQDPAPGGTNAGPRCTLQAPTTRGTNATPQPAPRTPPVGGNRDRPPDCPAHFYHQRSQHHDQTTAPDPHYQRDRHGPKRHQADPRRQKVMRSYSNPPNDSCTRKTGRHPRIHQPEPGLTNNQ
ncbi:uncharacterized protein LOC127038424 [Gopherus flavomarginatus]|uniref:uncharacterized protein LOC127038424 n=1 Tax=Gopherus flavomarginatus TaxID=286002 RepID=UPI0021CB9AD5|nr:uncharacterized protein LOC127038424 [Gopherus flavomarginatus]